MQQTAKKLFEEIAPDRIRPELPSRAEHVGSFLRPPELLTAREDFAAGRIEAPALREVEDAAIKSIAEQQEALGLKAITDGEYRRTFFHTDFLLQLDGVAERGGMEVAFKNAAGKDVRFAPPKIVVDGKIAHSHPIQLADYEFLAGVCAETPKITIPSPTMLHFRAGRDGIPAEVYPDLAEFFEDVAAAYRAEIGHLAQAGCSYLQFDDTNLAYLCDETQRERARERGIDPDRAPQIYADLINGSLRDAPDEMIRAIHLCRGNFRSSWTSAGGYDPVAEVLFNELDIDAFFLEYDDARSGDFAPLRFLPRGKTAVLGLVTTKSGEIEAKDEIRRRIEEAAKFAPLDQLALSPQCGFASTVHGNDLTVAEQAAKVRLVVEVAEEVWG